MRRLSGEAVAGCDVVVTVDMLCFLSCQQCLELLCDERNRLIFHPGLLREYPMSCHFEMGEVSQVLSSFGCDRCHTATCAWFRTTARVVLNHASSNLGQRRLCWLRYL